MRVRKAKPAKSERRISITPPPAVQWLGQNDRPERQLGEGGATAPDRVLISEQNYGRWPKVR
jgi:hypothetical protein